MLLLPIGLMASAAAATPLLFDTLSATILSGWSTRKLRTAYSGSCLRVRRSTDNVESDIGFNAAKTLDTTALLAFVGSASGYVSALYDQGASAKHMTQATASMQPMIVNAGALCLFQTGGVPAPLWSSGGSGFTTSFTTSGDPLYAACAINRQDSSNYCTFCSYVASGDTGDGSSYSQNVLYFSPPDGMASYRGGGTSLTVGSSGPMVVSVLAASNTLTLRKNNSTSASGSYSSTLGTTGTLYMGYHAAGDHQTGPFGEMIVASAGITSADRQTIERSMGGYFGVTVA